MSVDTAVNRLASAIINIARKSREVREKLGNQLTQTQTIDADTIGLFLSCAIDPRTFPDVHKRDQSLGVMAQGLAIFNKYMLAFNEIAVLAVESLSEDQIAHQKLIAHLNVLANYDDALMDTWVTMLTSRAVLARARDIAPH